MRRPLLLVCLCLVVLMAFCHYAGDPPWDDLPEEQTISAIGRICQKDEESFYLTIQNAAVSQQENSQTSQIKNLKHYKVICEYQNADKLFLGSLVMLRGDFRAFSPATNPGEFDYAKYYHSLGVAGRIKGVEILDTGERYSPVLELLYHLKCYWKARLYEIFPEKEASVMTAVLLGDKSNLDSHIKELYQSNGIIHILSISGLHITLIGLGLYRLLRRLGAPTWLAALCGGVLLVLYGIMTGLSVSACRAIGMYLLRMLALLCGRTYDMLTALGVMAVLLVWRNPGYLEYMGFWLSFGSILGVGVLCPTLTPTKDERSPGKMRYREERFGRILGAAGKRIRETAVQGLTAGIAITLTTLPLQLWFTYEVPVYSVVLNMLILPFMSVVMAFGLVAMLVPGLGFAGTVDVLILSGYEGLCALFEKMPFHTWNPGRPRIWQIILYYGLWLAVVLGTEWYRQRRGKGSEAGKVLHPAAVRAGKAVVLAAAVFVLAFSFSREDRVTFLDVGQGDCICVQFSTGEVYLFDCGSSSRGKIGERVLIPFLKYYGISHVDAVFLSHGDEDHMNGLLELLALGGQEHITVGRVVLPEIDGEKREEALGKMLEAVRNATQKKTIGISFVKAGDSLWNAGGEAGRFLCLHPPAGFPAENDNACSECFYMEFENGFSMLLTGDVEGAGETALLNELCSRDIGDVTVLKTAHHGSRNSTSPDLLEQLSPTLAVISCGRNNRYGHPHEELLERMEQVGAEVLRTDESGAITLHIGKERVVMELFCK